MTDLGEKIDQLSKLELNVIEIARFFLHKRGINKIELEIK